MTQTVVEHEERVGTTAPPAPPGAPPATATAAPKPPRRGCMIAAVVVVAVLLLVAGLGALGWFLFRGSSSQSGKATPSAVQQQMSAFASAMQKAGVKSPAAPVIPVELTSVHAAGSHSFDATFTPDELAALMNAFHHQVTVGTMGVSISDATLQLVNGDLSLAGKVTAGGNAYSGTVSGKVTFVDGTVNAPAPFSIQAEGIGLNGAQALQATELLLSYVNGYLDAAPGLKVQSAAVTAAGVHATGTAPDEISW